MLLTACRASLTSGYSSFRSQQQHKCSSFRSPSQQWSAQPCLLPQTAQPCRSRQAPRRWVTAAAGRDPYELLGVPRTASVGDIKKAFRKRALKLHPDVNKAPDARERFMEAKQAYQQLLDEREGRGRGSSSSSARSGSSGSASSSGFGGAGSWGSYGRTSSSSSSSYRQAGQQQWKPPEPDYTFGDLLRDLDKELSSYAAERQRKRGGTVPKSLWEELYDIGEEFVDFLEQNMNVSDDEAASYSAFKQKYGDQSGSSSGAGSSSSSAGSSSSGGGGGGGSARTMSSAFGSGSASSSSRTGGTSSAGSGYNSSRSGASGSSQIPPERKTTAEYVEDELAALKRKLGKQ